MPLRWRLRGVASVAGGLLAAVASRLVTVGRRPQGIAAGADGHEERIKADRAGCQPTYLRRHTAPARTPPRRRVERAREVGALPHGTGAARPRRRHEGATGRSMGHG